MSGRSNSGGRPPAFTYREQIKPLRGGRPVTVLNCESVPIPALAERYGTPLYVYSGPAIRERLRTFDRAFRGIPHSICYSVKANSNLAILRLLHQAGCGFDVVSGGELQRVLTVNRRAARQVVFSGVGKTAAEMELALKSNILLFNVESESELARLADTAALLKKTANIALRVNPDVNAETHAYISTGLQQHKFGIPISTARRLYAEAGRTRWLRVAGVSVHIGSQITSPGPFAEAMERVAELVRALRGDCHRIEYIDAGGGLGIPYEHSESDDFSKRAERYANAVTKPLGKLKVHLLLEPGRAIVGPAGALITRIIYLKQNNAKRFIITDAAMSDLLRPALYKAFHEIVPVKPTPSASAQTYDVVGPICETGDFFARDRELPEAGEGDLLAILDAGAYGMVLSSNYNTRPRAAEVLVDGKTARIIRRRESFGDLIAAEILQK